MNANRRVRILLLTVAIVTIASVAGFALARGFGQNSGANAQGPQDRPPFWYLPILQAEAQKPRTVQTINGITTGPVDTAVDASECANGAVDAPITAADGSTLQVRPAFLPKGTTTEEGGHSTRCGGSVVLTTVTYSIPADPPSGRFGGWITITRQVLTKPTVYLNLPAEHFSPGSIKGRPAVFVAPPTEEGFGEAAIVVKEDYGVTLIQSRGLTLGDLMKIADGLY